MAPRGITGRQPASHILVAVKLAHKASSLPSELHTPRQCELTLEPPAISELPLSDTPSFTLEHARIFLALSRGKKATKDEIPVERQRLCAMI
jgi:hypothetical protein